MIKNCNIEDLKKKQIMMELSENIEENNELCH